ncbi:aldo/keto reductase [Micromonospora chalcea]|uniref:aldo/keto reductase n=1 Tax=Micromonospora chalcea TaxID=1874 RepID=UPI001656CCD1|nr:aldo/keto reductase [Micromonospora chalcea]MBC8991451.1 aldo/keto reductase [Micromonospora chalcea]
MPRRAFELGVNHFDTAHLYGNGTANGSLAQDLDREHGVVVVTKAGARPTERGPLPMIPAQQPEQLHRGVLDNPRSLDTDHPHVVNMRRIAPGSFPLTREQNSTSTIR